LQLGLIVDYICTWARSQYREEILACLAEGRGFLRRYTSPMPSQISDSDFVSRQARHSLSVRLSEDPGIANGYVSRLGSTAPLQNADPTVPVMDPGHHDEGEARDMDDPYSWLRFTSWISGASWTRIGTIRHANIAQVHFQSLLLPEGVSALQDCLARWFPNEGIAAGARRLLSTLQYSGIDTIAGSRGDSGGSRLKPPLRTFTYMRTWLRSLDWQIERYVLCLSCTTMSVKRLSRLAGMENGHLEATESRHEYDVALIHQATDPSEGIGGREGAALAMAPPSRRQLCFRLRSDPAGREYSEADVFRPGELGQLRSKDVGTIRANISAGGWLGEYAVEWRMTRRFNTRSRSSVLASDREDQLVFAEKQCVLIKKRPGWPSETPPYCLLVLDEHIDFADERVLCSLLQTALDKEDIFGSGVRLDNEDKLKVRKWIHELAGGQTAI
jgi:hypothetical protein